VYHDAALVLVLNLGGYLPLYDPLEEGFRHPLASNQIFPDRANSNNFE
jgi:hypothetical protein